MSKCHAQTYAARYCTRYASDRAGKFCWQHTKEKKIDKKDLPKKPLSPFMLFAMDIRPQIKEAHPDWDVPDIGKEMARRWRAAPVPVLDHYTNLSLEAQRKYDEDLEAMYKDDN